MLEARRRSHASVSVRPVRLDELLATHAKLRCLNVCLHGLPKTYHEMEENLTALVLQVLRVLVGADVTFRESFRVCLIIGL